MLLAGDVVLISRRNVGHIETISHPFDLVGGVLIHEKDHLVWHKEVSGVLGNILDTKILDAGKDVLGIAVLEDALDILTVTLKIDGVAGDVVMRKAVLTQQLEHGLSTGRNLLSSKMAIAFTTAVKTGK